MATTTFVLAPLYTWDREPGMNHWVPPLIEGTIKIAFGRLSMDGLVYRNVGQTVPFANQNILDATRIGLTKVFQIYSLTPQMFVKSSTPAEPAYLMWDRQANSFRLWRCLASNIEMNGHTLAADGNVVFDLMVFGN